MPLIWGIIPLSRLLQHFVCFRPETAKSSVFADMLKPQDMVAISNAQLALSDRIAALSPSLMAPLRLEPLARPLSSIKWA